MEKVHDWIIEAMGTDGVVHCLISAFLTAFIGVFLPMWLAVIIVLIIGIAKEVYDKVSNKGDADIKDFVCNLIGVAIGAL